MLSLAIISGLQICFLPGYILYRLLVKKIEKIDLLQSFIFSFALSLITNYLIVSTLVFFNFYTKNILLIVFFIEMAIFIILCLIDRKLFSNSEISKKTNLLAEGLIDFIKFEKNITYYIRISFFIFVILIIIKILIIFEKNLGSIFDKWDAIISWNRWAVDFFNNRFPTSTWHYPQLLPANWSISYVIMGYPFQYVAKAIMPLFLLFMIIFSFIKGVKDKSIIFLSAAVFMYLAFSRFAWTDGYVDIPVAFFCLLSIYCLLMSEELKNKTDVKRLVILGAIIACGSAVTKQAGIYLVAVYPILTFILTKDRISWTIKNTLFLLLLYILFISFIIMPFYIYAEMNIVKGLNGSEVSWVTEGIYGGATFIERFNNAFLLFIKLFGNKIIFFAILPFWILSLTQKKYRTINLILVVPFYIIWALFFSYDIRNVILMLPVFFLSIGAGIESILKPFFIFLIKLNKLFKKILLLRYIVLVILCWLMILGYVSTNKRLTYKKLYNDHINKEKKIGNDQINSNLYEYFNDNVDDKLILSNYQYLGFLPDLKVRYKLDHFNSIDVFLENIEDKNVYYIMLGSSSSKEIIEFVNKQILSNKYKEIFDIRGYKFVKIR